MIENLHESWKPLFFNTIDSEFFRKVDNLIEGTFYPPKDKIFRVFEMPVEDIKVVILGQDPYPKEGQAIGLSFAVSEETSKPASLRNIEKEVGHEIDRTLQPWVDQGVFMLNTALTVQANNTGSDIEHWSMFTKNIIKFISETNPCVWMLWGKKAQVFKEYLADYIYDYPKLDELHMNVVLEAAHPAAESYKSDAGFFGCNHFYKANVALALQDKETINW